jgi:hypothetical protein
MKPNAATAGRYPHSASIRIAVLLGVVLVGAAIWTPSRADEAASRSAVEDAGHATGSTMREIGHGAAQAGRSVGHAARDVAVVTWYGVREAGLTIGRTARNGSKALVRGLKAER